MDLRSTRVEARSDRRRAEQRGIVQVEASALIVKRGVEPEREERRGTGTRREEAEREAREQGREMSRGARAWQSEAKRSEAKRKREREAECSVRE